MKPAARTLIPLASMVVPVLLIVGMAHAQCTSSGTFCNPLNSTGSSIAGFIGEFLKAIVEVALPILTLFIVYSGFLFVYARGNEAELKRAKNNFLYVIIGAILILGAYELSTIISGTVKQVTSSTST